MFTCSESFTCVGIYLLHLLFADSGHEFHFDFTCQTSAPRNLTRSANVSIRVTERSYQERIEGLMNNGCLNGALSDLQVQENLVNVPIAAFEAIKIKNSDSGDLSRRDCFTNMSGTRNFFCVVQEVVQAEYILFMDILWFYSLVLCCYKTYYFWHRSISWKCFLHFLPN